LVDDTIAAMRPEIPASDRETLRRYIDLLNLAADLRLGLDTETEQATLLLGEARQLLEEQFKREKTGGFMLSYIITQRLYSLLLRRQDKLEEAQAYASRADGEARELVARLALVEALVARADAATELAEVARALSDSEKADQSLKVAQESLSEALQKAPDCQRIRAKLQSIQGIKSK
jgi:hypothetical protein